MTEEITNKQPDMFLSANMGWFHIFNDMVVGGDLKKLMNTCPSSIGVYLVIKSMVHYKKGVSFPSVSTLMEKTGLSNATIHKSLKALEQYGYITINREGRNNVYRVREKIQVKDKQKEDVAVVSFDYFSSVVSDVRNEIKKFLIKPQDEKHYQYIQIENLNINLNQQINNGEGGVQYNQPVNAKTLSITEEEHIQVQQWREEGLSWIEITQKRQKMFGKPI